MGHTFRRKLSLIWTISCIVKVMQCQTSVNFASTSHGTTCEDNLESPSQRGSPCSRALDGVVSGWHTDLIKFPDTKFKAIFARAYNFSVVGLQAVPYIGYEIPREVKLELKTVDGSTELTLMLENRRDIQWFDRGVKNDLKTVRSISEVAIDISEVTFIIKKVHFDLKVGKIGFNKVEIIQEYKKVYTQDDSTMSDYCHFPFMYNKTSYDSCAELGEGDEKKCVTKRGLVRQCLYPQSSCPTLQVPEQVIGAAGMAEDFCLGQGACYSTSDNLCRKASHSCPPDYFGPQCEERCNCVDLGKGCDIVNGRNSACVCIQGHTALGSKCERDREPKIYISRGPSPGEVTCRVSAVPVVDTNDVTLKRVNDGRVFSEAFSSENGTERYMVYSIQSAQEDVLLCTASNKVGISEQTFVTMADSDGEPVNSAAFTALIVLTAVFGVATLVLASILLVKWCRGREHSSGTHDDNAYTTGRARPMSEIDENHAVANAGYDTSDAPEGNYTTGNFT